MGEEKYFFEGDLNQMRIARKIADKNDMITGIDGGLSYVTTKEDYDAVVKYIIDNRVEGWWNYVGREDYLKLSSM